MFLQGPVLQDVNWQVQHFAMFMQPCAMKLCCSKLVKVGAFYTQVYLIHYFLLKNLSKVGMCLTQRCILYTGKYVNQQLLLHTRCPQSIKHKSFPLVRRLNRLVTLFRTDLLLSYLLSSYAFKHHKARKVSRCGKNTCTGQPGKVAGNIVYQKSFFSGAARRRKKFLRSREQNVTSLGAPRDDDEIGAVIPWVPE